MRGCTVSGLVHDEVHIGARTSFLSQLSPLRELRRASHIYSEQALIRVRRQDSGVGLVARILRTCTPHSPPRHDVLRSTDVLHSTDRAHRGDHDSLRRGLVASRRASWLCTRVHPNSRKTTNTAGTQPPGLLCPEAQVNRSSSRKHDTRDEGVNAGRSRERRG